MARKNVYDRRILLPTTVANATICFIIHKMFTSVNVKSVKKQVVPMLVLCNNEQNVRKNTPFRQNNSCFEDYKKFKRSKIKYSDCPMSRQRGAIHGKNY